MFLHYLKTAWRVLLRNKSFSLINIFSLALGLAACLFIAEYVAHEWSYERFNPDSEQVYRISTRYIRNGEEIYFSAKTFAGVGEDLTRSLPEVESFGRLFPAGIFYNTAIISENNERPLSSKEENLFYADQEILDLLGMKWLKGEQQKALTEPNSIVLSEKTAIRIFGKENPIGQILKIEDNVGHQMVGKITGVAKDMPSYSHFQFSVLVSYSSLYAWPAGENYYRENWNQNYFYTYLKLRQGSSPKRVEGKLPALVDQFKPRYTEIDETGKRIRINELSLIPIREIHLQSHFQDELRESGNEKSIQVMLAIGILILCIAWFNYINLTTARATQRAREVGMRKMIGASRIQLLGQFFTESALINLFAFLVAFTFLQLFLPAFHQLLGQPFELILHKQPLFWICVAGGYLISIFMTGFYPALVLSRFKLDEVLQGRYMTANKKINLTRKTLVLGQFAVSGFLIVITLGIFNQIQYMQNRPLGFSPEQTLVIETPARLNQHDNQTRGPFEYFQNQLTALPEILAVGNANSIPGKNILRGLGVSTKITDSPSDVKSIKGIWVDEGFMDAISMDITEGRNFSASRELDSKALILTESAARLLGFESGEEAIGRQAYLYGREAHQIIGIVGHYHHESLKKNDEPMFFKLTPGMEDYFLVKLDVEQAKNSIQKIEDTWNSTFSGNPLNYYFLDSFFNQQYQSDQKMGRVVGVFTFLAILIALAGMVGLAVYNILSRQKEISIRKVLGATVRDIILLLSTNLMGLILLSQLLAIPITWFALNKWLEQYPYRIEISPFIFLIALLAIIGLAFGAIGFQTLSAARMNPVENLRRE